MLTQLQHEGKQPATLLRHLTVLKAIFNRAVRHGRLLANPTTRVKIQKPNNTLVRYLTNEQEDMLLKHLPPQYRGIILTALNTGLRQGELLQLTWADVDWNVGVLTVNETKAGERRRVPMNSTVVGILSELREADQNGEGRIFVVTGRYLRRVFDKAVRASGLAPFRFHDLRHTFASRLAMQGANDRTLMALGGWKSPAMLNRYAHLSPTHLYQAVEDLTRFTTVTKTVTNEIPKEHEAHKSLGRSGEPAGTRTQGPRLKRAMLYRLSYRLTVRRVRILPPTLGLCLAGC